MPSVTPGEPTFWRGHDGELESADDYPYWLGAPRFTVLTCEGFTIRHGNTGGNAVCGVSATALDRAYDRELVTFRSEDARGRGGRLGRKGALRAANEYAAVLNGEEASPTRGTGSSER